MKKLSIDYIREQIEIHEYTLLSREYKNVHTKLNIQCNKGHEYKATWAQFWKGQRCPHCYGNTKLKYKDVQKYITSQGYMLISKEYKGCKNKLYIKCDKGHRYTTRWNDFQQGTRCPHCAKNRKIDIQQVKEYLDQQRYTLLSKEYRNAKTKMLIRCEQGHEYKTTWDIISREHRCPYCTGKMVRTYQEIKKHIEQQKCTLLSKEYKNNTTKLKIKCPQGHQYYASWNTFQRGCRCPKCNESKGEKRIAEALTSLSLPFTRQHKIGKGRTALRLDFYISSLDLGIEYDGKHHFEPVRFGGMSLEKAKECLKKQQKNDCRKEKLCKKYGYRLVRIAYSENLTLETIKSKVQIGCSKEVLL